MDFGFYLFISIFGISLYSKVMASGNHPSTEGAYWEEISERLRKEQEKRWLEAPPDDQAEWDLWLSENPGMEAFVPYKYQNQYEVVTSLRDINPAYRLAQPIIPSIVTTTAKTDTPPQPNSPAEPTLRYYCPVQGCDQRFGLADDLRRHFFTHDQESPRQFWRCFICNLSYAEKELVFAHLRSTHNDIVDMTKKCDSELEYYVVDHRGNRNIS